MSIRVKHSRHLLGNPWSQQDIFFNNIAHPIVKGYIDDGITKAPLKLIFLAVGGKDIITIGVARMWHDQGTLSGRWTSTSDIPTVWHNMAFAVPDHHAICAHKQCSRGRGNSRASFQIRKGGGEHLWRRTGKIQPTQPAKHPMRGFPLRKRHGPANSKQNNQEEAWYKQFFIGDDVLEKTGKDSAILYDG